MAAAFEDFYILEIQDNDEYKKVVEYARAVKEIAPTHGKEMVCDYQKIIF